MLSPRRLRCEYRTDPLGIDVRRPRFSWELFDERPDSVQTGYRVVVARSLEGLDAERDLAWDSGEVDSAEQFSIEYDGAALESATRYWWRVRVRDRDGRTSIPSQSAWFETALFEEAEWGAHWIDDGRALPERDEDYYEDDPAPLLRKSFEVEGDVLRARLYLTGLGHVRASVNGARVGDAELEPGWTDYAKRVLYATHDVTADVRSGRNVLAAELGAGWFHPLPLRMWGWLDLREHLTVGRPRLLARLVVETTAGTPVVASDETWRVHPGPLRRNSVYLGEVYDARRELPGWERADFDDGSWEHARAVDERLGELRASTIPPVREQRRITAATLTEPAPGVFVFDFGENTAGWIELRIDAPRDTRVRLRYGELLHPDGTLNPNSSVCGQIRPGGEDPGPGAPRLACQEDTYVCRGGGEERWSPRFSFRGFRYVEWTGTPTPPTRDALEAVVLSADLEPTADFACSNELFERMHAAVVRTFRSNLFSVQSDCPHREKFGYGGDIVATCEAVSLLFDTASFYAKTVLDFADAAREGGGLTETAPYVGVADRGFGGGTGPIGWAGAFVVLQEHLRKQYGERRVLEEQLETTRRWIEFMRAHAVGHLYDGGLSDWGSIDAKPHAVTSSAYYYWNVRLAAAAAREVGEVAVADDFDALAADIRAAFQGAFCRPGTGEVERHNQVCQAHALFLDLVPEADRERAVEVLVREIVEHRNHHFATGFQGTRFLLDVLTEAGRADLAYRVLNRTSFPGIGHMLARGATTLLESWDTTDDTSSQNHPAYGSVSAWFLKALAGIDQMPDSRAWSHVRVRPQVVGDLRWVRAHHDSIRGRIAVSWRRDDERLRLHVVLPPNTRGTVEVPTSDPSAVTWSGFAERLEEGGRRLVLGVRSGEFEVVGPLAGQAHASGASGG